MSDWKSPNNNPWDRDFPLIGVEEEDDEKNAAKIIADAVAGAFMLWIIHVLIFWGASHVLEFGLSLQKITAFTALYILFRVVDKLSIGKTFGK